MDDTSLFCRTILETRKTDTLYGCPTFRQRRFQKMQEKYNVTGMTCAACQARVQKSVSNLTGVQECNVNLLKNSMVVTYDDKNVNSGQIIAAVEKAGYGASLQQAKGKSAAQAVSPMDTAKKEYETMKRRVIWSFVSPARASPWTNRLEIRSSALPSIRAATLKCGLTKWAMRPHFLRLSDWWTKPPAPRLLSPNWPTRWLGFCANRHRYRPSCDGGMADLRRDL